jgi:starch synthase
MTRPRVLLVTSEVIPLVKTGGLADVIGALSVSLEEHSVDITVLLPGYPAAMQAVSDLHKIAHLAALPGGDGELYLGHMPETGIKILLLSSARFDKRIASPYVDHSGHELDDNALAFASLAHTAMRICAGKANYPVPHIVHANDWHAALIPALLHKEHISSVGSVLTIHNLAFQGNYDTGLAPELGIPETMLSADGAEFWGKLSFLKAGIAYSNCITTVSNKYAEEILTERFGNGLDGALCKRQQALRAIPNGVDSHAWNPSTDKLIKANFSVDNMIGKALCKRELQKIYGLPTQPFVPLMAVGSRITHQKMADVLLAAIPSILDKNPLAQLVVLGCGSPEYEQGFQELAANYPQRVGVHIGYDEQLAHALHAGADILLHPSRFEPYGLTPIYSMLYGTIPVGSNVGGMCDTIVPATPDMDSKTRATGVMFDGENPADLIDAVEHAFALYKQPSIWQAMQRNAMASDFSWNGPAESYIRMYAEIAPPSARQFFLNALQPKNEKSEPKGQVSHYKLSA